MGLYNQTTIFQTTIRMSFSRNKHHSTMELKTFFSNSVLVQELVNNESVTEHISSSSETHARANPTSNSKRSLEFNNEFHLTNLSKDTTREVVMDYLKFKGIDEISHVKITPLIPRNRDPSTLSYLSYKIDTNDEIAKILQMKEFWPTNSKFKKFIHKRPATADLTAHDPNFQTRTHRITTNRRSN